MVKIFKFSTYVNVLSDSLRKQYQYFFLGTQSYFVFQHRPSWGAMFKKKTTKKKTTKKQKKKDLIHTNTLRNTSTKNKNKNKKNKQ